MAMPVHVSFHNMDRCGQLEKSIFLHAGKLKTLYGGATSCRVAVIASKHRENRFKVLDVVVDLSARTLPSRWLMPSNAQPGVFGTIGASRWHSVHARSRRLRTGNGH